MPTPTTPRAGLRRLAAAAAALALALPLAACSSGPETPRDSLVIATGDAEPACLDPHVGGNWPQALLGAQVLESLFSRDASGEIIPWLATGAEEAPDHLSWTITLREGVTFTDGTPFDADAVVRNIQHVKDPATKSSTGVLALAKVREAVSLDATHVRLDLTQPDAALLASLAQTWLAMESPAGLDRGMDANCLAPIGTGPFSIASWTKQESIELVRNDAYSSPPADAAHDGPPALRTVTWRFIPDASARLAALESGQVDLIDSVQPDAAARFAAEGSQQVISGARPGVTARLELNSRPGEIFEDESVRLAFRAATDLDAAVESLYFGVLDRSTSVLSSSTPYALPMPELFSYDPARANALLDAAGWTDRDADGTRMKDGRRLEVRLPVSTNQSIPAEVSILEQIAATAGEVGFSVRLDKLDLASWYARAGAWDFDAIIAPYTKDSPDVLRIVYSSSGIPPAPSGYHANNLGVSTPERDALLEEAAATTDPAVQQRDYEAVQRELLEHGYVIPITDQMVWFAASPKVEGFRLQPNLNVPTLLGVTLKP